MMRGDDSYLVPIAAECLNQVLEVPPQPGRRSSMAMFHRWASHPIDDKNRNNASVEQVRDHVE
jgi:hypothetical protein